MTTEHVAFAFSVAMTALGILVTIAAIVLLIILPSSRRRGGYQDGFTDGMILSWLLDNDD